MHTILSPIKQLPLNLILQIIKQCAKAVQIQAYNRINRTGILPPLHAIKKGFDMTYLFLSHLVYSYFKNVQFSKISVTVNAVLRNHNPMTSLNTMKMCEAVAVIVMTVHT